MTVAATYAPPTRPVRHGGRIRSSHSGGQSADCADGADFFYLPFSPVPVTGQTLGVLLVGTLLGGMRGSLAVLAYLAEGASGLPVFAGGALGAAYFLVPRRAICWALSRGVCDRLAGRTRL